jgi:hypothetical protein
MRAYLVYTTFNFLDVVLTFLGVAHGRCQEGNPIVARGMAMVGEEAALTIWFVATQLVIYLVMRRFPRLRRALVLLPLQAAVGWMFFYLAGACG